MKSFGGAVLFLDRSDINTDEIIPAKYLTEISKAALAPYCLEDLKAPGFEPSRDVKGKAAVVARANFGCGSSREHAPWALEANGIHLVLASSFARIFRQNMYNCGLMAVELPEAEIEALFSLFAGTPTTVELRLGASGGAGRLVFSSEGGTREIDFSLAPFDAALVASGGWVEFADAKY
jgi:3-isopropylmalate/(R)-2-methylmalate dehydratase small subunit